MGDELGLGILANLLSLPAARENQRQQDEIDRQALLGLGSMDPGQVDQYIPAPKPPGLFEKVMSPVGTLGTVLSAVLGQPVKAPRLDINRVATISSIGKSQGDIKAGKLLAESGQLKSAVAQELARQGKIDEALKIENGGSGGGLTYSKAVDILTNPNSSPEQRERARAYADEYQGGSIDTSVKRARAMQPIQRENAAGNAEITGAITDRRAQERERQQREERLRWKGENMPEMLTPRERQEYRQLPSEGGGIRQQSGRTSIDQPFRVQNITAGGTIPTDEPPTSIFSGKTATPEGGSVNAKAPDMGQGWTSWAAANADKYGRDPQWLVEHPFSDPQASKDYQAYIDAKGNQAGNASARAAARPALIGLNAAEAAIRTGKNRFGKPLLLDVSGMQSQQPLDPWDVGSVLEYGKNRLQRDYVIGVNAAGPLDEEVRNGNPTAVALKNWSMQLPQLARSFGDVGNISDQAIRRLDEFTDLRRMSQPEALQAMASLKALLSAIANGDPSTTKDGQPPTPQQIQARQAFVQVAYGGDSGEADEGQSDALDLGDGFSLRRK